MRELEDKEIFQLFRSKLTDTDDFVDGLDNNWDVFEKQLENKKRRKVSIIQFYRIVSGVAAILLLFFCWKMSREINPAGQSVVNTRKQVYAIKDREQTRADKSRDKRQPSVKNIKTPTQSLTRKYNKNTTDIDDIKDTIPGNSTAMVSKLENILMVPTLGQMEKGFDSLAIAELTTTPVIDTFGHQNLLYKKKEKVIKSRSPRFALSILAAPEMSGISSFNSIQTGTSIIISLSYRITRKLSISTGADYSAKPYETSFSNYRGGKTAWWARSFANSNLPEDVLANCKVLDIPLNLNYQLFAKGKNSIILGTGLSSYFMLNENYSFRFSDPASAPQNLDLKNDNKHLLGVLNLNSTFKHKLSGNFDLVVQPYFKLPLTKIGFGQVNLKSAGVAVGFNWNINNMLKSR